MSLSRDPVTLHKLQSVAEFISNTLFIQFKNASSTTPSLRKLANKIKLIEQNINKYSLFKQYCLMLSEIEICRSKLKLPNESILKEHLRTYLLAEIEPWVAGEREKMAEKIPEKGNIAGNIEYLLSLTEEEQAYRQKWRVTENSTAYPVWNAFMDMAGEEISRGNFYKIPAMVAGAFGLNNYSSFNGLGLSDQQLKQELDIWNYRNLHDYFCDYLIDYAKSNRNDYTLREMGAEVGKIVRELLSILREAEQRLSLNGKVARHFRYDEEQQGLNFGDSVRQIESQLEAYKKQGMVARYSEDGMVKPVLPASEIKQRALPDNQEHQRLLRSSDPRETLFPRQNLQKMLPRSNQTRPLSNDVHVFKINKSLLILLCVCMGLMLATIICLSGPSAPIAMGIMICAALGVTAKVGTSALIGFLIIGMIAAASGGIVGKLAQWILACRFPPLNNRKKVEQVSLERAYGSTANVNLRLTDTSPTLRVNEVRYTTKARSILRGAKNSLLLKDASALSRSNSETDLTRSGPFLPVGEGPQSQMAILPPRR